MHALQLIGLLMHQDDKLHRNFKFEATVAKEVKSLRLRLSESGFHCTVVSNRTAYGQWHASCTVAVMAHAQGQVSVTPEVGRAHALGAFKVMSLLHSFADLVNIIRLSSTTTKNTNLKSRSR